MDVEDSIESDVDVVIRGNSFMNNSVHDRSLGHRNSLIVTNNNIQAEYLINSDQEGTYIQITDNNLEITYPGYCMEKDSSSPSLSDVAVDYSNMGGSSTDEGDDEYPFLPGQGTNVGPQDSGSDDSTTLVAAAAAIVVIMLAVVALMVTRKN